jgi:5-methylcytosine-specific restriction protein A
MTPQEIRLFVEREYEDVVVEALDQGFSFWLGRKQISPDSTRLVRAVVRNERTMLKRAATSLKHGRDVEQSFAGDIGELREIFKAERLLVQSCQQTGLDKEAPELSFEIGVIYDRRTHIHGPFGGNLQSGISPSSRMPAIFLFSGASGHQFGYHDREDGGVFYYCGEGQVGNMTFTKGNAAVRDHVARGRALHLFKTERQGQRYLGEYVCADHELTRGIDRTGQERDVIIFHLVRVQLVQDTTTNFEETHEEVGRSLEELRRRADAACVPQEAGKGDTALRKVYLRSKEVKRYVLARAAGRCESCRQAAPFKNRQGQDFLEPHHTTRVSDGGLDHRTHVAAICPNCHQEIHHGVAGHEKNDALIVYVTNLEAEIERHCQATQ